MSVAAPPDFTIRAWSVVASREAEDSPAGPILDLAIERAWAMAKDQRYRSVMVIDPFMTCWAQFNMLWSIEKGIG